MTVFKLIIIFLAFVLALCAWTEQPNQPFLDALDELWGAGEFSEMGQLIENQLLVFEEDPQALVAGFYYHLIVSNDVEKARVFSDRIISKAKAQGVEDSEWISQFVSPLEELEVLEESAAEKEERLKQMKAQLSVGGGKPEFIRLLIQANAKALGWNDEEYRKRQAVLWNQWKGEQFDLIQELGEEQLIKWAKNLIERHESPVTLAEDEIPEVLRTTERPRILIDSEEQVRIELYKFVNTSYGYVISLSGVLNTDDGFMRVEIISEHVGWYLTRG